MIHFIDAATVHGLLDYKGLVAALREAHRGAMPEVRELFMPEPGAAEGEEGRGFLVLPAWQSGGMLGVKLVTVFPDNPRADPPVAANQGLYAAFDARNGMPCLIADGTALTLRKTAADSALGAEILARPDARTMVMLGAGALAPHLINALIAVRPSIRHVLLWNRSPARALALAATLRIPGVEIEVTENLDQAVAAGDIISSATMATAPLIRGALLRPGTHVDLVGGWQPSMRESDDETVRRALLFADTLALSRDCGDFLQPVSSGLIQWSDIGADHFGLCTGQPGRRSTTDITLFKNAGGGHLDLFTAQYLLARFKEQSSVVG